MIFAVMVFAQGVYTKPCTDKALEKKAVKWVNSGKWRNGFKMATPHESVNVVEFYTQYKKNPEQWKAMFKWLSTRDLLTIEKGKYTIEGTKLIASVEDSENGDLSERKSESHYKHIDFQFVVKGTERFGIIDHETSKPNSQYRPDVIHYEYDNNKTLFYDSTPDKFLFSFRMIGISPKSIQILQTKNKGYCGEVRLYKISDSYNPSGMQAQRRIGQRFCGQNSIPPFD